MKLAVLPGGMALRQGTARLSERMLSPLAGMSQAISFVLRSRNGPRFFVAGGELTGVHVLAGHERPARVAAYHIGGCGLFLEEALIRTLGESIERYSQFVSVIKLRHDVSFESATDCERRGDRAISLEKLQLFTEAQLARPFFPFTRVSPDMPLGWVRAMSLLEAESVLVPAQMALVGYQAKANLGEARISAGVTTGSAAHTDKRLALKNALLELVQIDSAIGHWFSPQVAVRIDNDRRSAAIQRIVERRFPHNGPSAEFFWLPSPDLPGLTVACVVRQPSGVVPAVSVGLGIDLRLEQAMYKALLEGVGVHALSKFNLFDLAADEANEEWREPTLDRLQLLDLDTNVAFYALPENAHFLDEKFDSSKSVAASDLPADLDLDVSEGISEIVRAFAATGKELVLLDLTTPDIMRLGFTALRVWSPDTLSLPLPSAPPLKHPRFAAYGGAVHEVPHPYP